MSVIRDQDNPPLEPAGHAGSVRNEAGRAKIGWAGAGQVGAWQPVSLAGSDHIQG